ncbi:unnamed protein product [Paramecium sonneborni]|uniref:Uncharacterized protein n=1 Tax=Paramecium sonneborni TaxID=65129 RepID=A0A8S1RU01_9CILI|nr:unnamed protein product [Paramecium sonneborni]
MNSKLKVRNSILKWKYELEYEIQKPITNLNENKLNVQQLENHHDKYEIFDFGLSHDSIHLAIFEEKIRKINQTSRRTQGRYKSHFRVKLIELNSGVVVFTSSQLVRRFYYVNFQFSKKSNYFMFQGDLHGYILIDIQQKKEFVFSNLEDSYYILQFESIKNFYLLKNNIIFHINVEQINLQIEKEICIKFRFNVIFYFQSILQKFVLVSTELFHYIIYIQNLRVIKQRKKITDVRTQIIIFKNYLMVEQENIHETDYSVSLLNSGKLLRRVKTHFGYSGNIYQDENGVEKFNFTNIVYDNDICYYLVYKFDFFRGTYQEIPFKFNQQDQEDILKLKFGKQFILIQSKLKKNYIKCYLLN